MKFANILASAWHARTEGHLLVVEGALLPLEGSRVLPGLPDPPCFSVAQLQNLQQMFLPPQQMLSCAHDTLARDVL